MDTGRGKSSFVDWHHSDLALTSASTKMAVGVHNLAACHAPWNWHRPLDFVPERWLQTKDGDFACDDRGASRPFSYGRHDCIGQK